MKKNKRVLVLNPYLSTLGGGEKYMGYLCKFIEDYYKEDVQIDILVHNYNEVNVFAHNYITIEDVNKQYGLGLEHTNIRKIEIDKPVTIKDYITNKRIIEKITKEYDIFVNFMFLSKHIGKAKKNIYICMFPPKQFSKEVQPKWIHKIAAKYYDKRFTNSYNKIITISQFTNHWLYEYWKINSSNSIVYPPVFSEVELQDRYEEDKKENLIVSVGRFFVGSHSKKQLDMVKFFVNNEHRLGDYEYHLVGGISNNPDDLDYLEEIKKIARQSTKVHLHINYPFKELMKLYTKAKIFWHATGYGEDGDTYPEKMEHFGITTVEGMSFGAVPVVINKGGQPEIVQEGVSGYVWNTEEECIEKTIGIINDENLRRRIAQQAVKEAYKYSIESFYEGNRRIFDEL